MTNIDRVAESLRNMASGPMSMNAEHSDTCNELAAAADLILELRDLVRHCWVHSGYRNCGRGQMASKLGAVYDSIVVSAIWDGS